MLDAPQWGNMLTLHINAKVDAMITVIDPQATQGIVTERIVVQKGDAVNRFPVRS